jgi:hypothetical protein
LKVLVNCASQLHIGSHRASVKVYLPRFSLTLALCDSNQKSWETIQMNNAKSARLSRLRVKE